MPQKFPYGNYDRYYGYRNGGGEDPRISAMQEEWFRDKQVLDVGCNVGLVTTMIAKKFHPSHILGIDIDKTLVLRASRTLLRDNLENVSFCYVKFSLTQEDYVPPRGYVSSRQFDTIVALSLTKWVHLVRGDKGLRRVFRRMRADLREGGLLIVEFQPWDSYAKRRNSSAMAVKNYPRLKWRPAHFKEYLVDRLNFTHVEDVLPSNEISQAFSRTISVFRRGE